MLSMKSIEKAYAKELLKEIKENKGYEDEINKS